MRKPRSLLSLFFTLLALLPASAQEGGAYGALQRFVKNVEAFNKAFPQEKVYLHLDNTGYFVGETIWYKAYVVRTDHGTLSDLSGVLYVELVDPLGEVQQTQRLRIVGGQCNGDFSLDSLRTDGFYEIRAYTRYGTNWPTEALYSRVVPVFQRPATPGDWTDRRIREEFADTRNPGAAMADTLTLRERRQWRRGELPTVNFYPEGGHLVQGLQSLVAYDVALSDSIPASAEGVVLSVDGDTLGRTATLRDCRGTFAYTPTASPGALLLDVGGTRHRIPLPQAEAEGVVMGVNTQPARHVFVQVQASGAMHGRLLGLTRMYGGTVERFDTLRLGPQPATFHYPRVELKPGVHQLTLFDDEGNVWAERFFFIAPDAASRYVRRVTHAFAADTIAPYGEMTLRLRGTPGATVSLSVTDADAATNVYRGNAATHLLLSSEVRGFVRDADYYLEADDAAHRRAADLLMLVQGWRRYDWPMMAGVTPFEPTQPVEDGLYLDGQVMARQLWGGGVLASRKQKERAADVGGVDLRATLFNSRGEVMRGQFTTDSTGLFTFAMPDCTGDWTLFLSTKKEDKMQDYRIGLRRYFSPPRKDYAPGETDLIATPAILADTLPDAPLRSRAADFTDVPLPDDDAVRLGTAVVTARRNPLEMQHTRRAWEVTRRRADRTSQYHFFMDNELEEWLDNAADAPTVGTWLLSKPAVRREFFEKDRPICFLFADEEAPLQFAFPETSSHKPVSRFVSPHHSVDQFYFSGEEDFLLYPIGYLFDDPNARIPVTIDDVHDIYVSLASSNEPLLPLKFRARYGHRKPILVFVYPKYTVGFVKRKGVSRRTFHGYYAPHTFRALAFGELERGAALRRTVYWNPDVTFGTDGTASVTFHNTATCRRPAVVVEGVHPDGHPVLGAE
ncbi:MAG: hypothetical protein J6M53_05580 [Bacteroidaceae bacterium]|nr:hypothetical protein [Bacteroidaceae bacterium]